MSYAFYADMLVSEGRCVKHVLFIFFLKAEFCRIFAANEVKNRAKSAHLGQF